MPSQFKFSMVPEIEPNKARQGDDLSAAASPSR